MVNAGWLVTVVDVLTTTEDSPVGAEDAAPLTAKESVVPGCVGIGVVVEDCNGSDDGDDASEVVEPRVNVSCMLFFEVDAGAPGTERVLDIKGKVSPLLPEIV
jgi:hypothetical protein